MAFRGSSPVATSTGVLIAAVAAGAAYKFLPSLQDVVLSHDYTYFFFMKVISGLLVLRCSYQFVMSTVLQWVQRTVFASRRPTGAEAGWETPFGMPAEDYYTLKNVVHHSSMITSSRKLKLFTQSWLPASMAPRALLFMCHGYTTDSSWLFQVTAIEFATHGLAVYAIDYEGHGRSEGLRGGGRKFDDLVGDCYAHFKSVRLRPENAGLPCFVYGESLGGAVAVKVFKRDPGLWDGAVLSSPMLKIADNLRLAWAIELVLAVLAYVVPDAPIIPVRADPRLAYRDPLKLEITMANPHRYCGNGRVGPGAECLRVAKELEANLESIDFPFLVIHGEADKVTEPLVSMELFRRSRSKDKTLKVYPKALHQLLAGEPPKDVDVIWHDVFAWLDDRIERQRERGS